MKKTNNFLVAGVIGLVSTLLCSLFNFLLGKLLDGQVYMSGAEFRLMILFLEVAPIIAAMFVTFVIYRKIARNNEMSLIKIALFSVLAGVSHRIINKLIRYIFGFHILNFDYAIYCVLCFIATTVFTLLLLNSKERQKDAADSDCEKSKRENKFAGKYYPSFIIIVIIGYIIFTGTSVCITGFINEWDYRPMDILTLILFNLFTSVIYTYLYFLPYLLANKKNHQQTRAIYFLNILAGWTFIAWIIALIWGLTVPSEKKIIQQTVQPSAADELIKYKKLLDEGIITQEEFEMKKKQLLNN